MWAAAACLPERVCVRFGPGRGGVQPRACAGRPAPGVCVRACVCVGERACLRTGRSARAERAALFSPQQIRPRALRVPWGSARRPGRARPAAARVRVAAGPWVQRAAGARQQALVRLRVPAFCLPRALLMSSLGGFAAAAARWRLRAQLPCSRVDVGSFGPRSADRRRGPAGEPTPPTPHTAGAAASLARVSLFQPPPPPPSSHCGARLALVQAGESCPPPLPGPPSCLPPTRHSGRGRGRRAQHHLRSLQQHLRRARWRPVAAQQLSSERPGVSALACARGDGAACVHKAEAARLGRACASWGGRPGRASGGRTRGARLRCPRVFGARAADRWWSWYVPSMPFALFPSACVPNRNPAQRPRVCKGGGGGHCGAAPRLRFSLPRALPQH